jgi:hypothetical protein
MDIEMVCIIVGLLGFTVLVFGSSQRKDGYEKEAQPN